MLARRARAKTHENRDQPDWVDGDKDRNEGEEKFLNHHGTVACPTILATDEHR